MTTQHTSGARAAHTPEPWPDCCPRHARGRPDRADLRFEPCEPYRQWEVDGPDGTGAYALRSAPDRVEAESGSREALEHIAACVNALDGYDPQALPEVVKALEWYADSSYGRARTALSRLQGKEG